MDWAKARRAGFCKSGQHVTKIKKPQIRSSGWIAYADADRGDALERPKVEGQIHIRPQRLYAQYWTIQKFPAR